MSFCEFHNIGAEIATVSAGAAATQTAGSTAAVTGAVTIDRETHNMPLSCVLLVTWSATLGATKTMSLAYELDHGEASNLSDSAAFASATAAVQATGPTGGGTVNGVLAIALDLAGAKRYLKAKITPTLSDATTTDTVTFATAVIFGGEGLLPAV